MPMPPAGWTNRRDQSGRGMGLRPERKTVVAKKLTKKMIEARIQSAVTGFRIPMLSIPKLHARLEHAVKSEMTDEYLKTIVAEWPGVEVA